MTHQTFAKALRANQTDAERRLWQQLRARRFMGVKFRRQQPIGPYIVDFISLEHRLIIELDGGQHSEQPDYDQQRDAWLRSQGFRVMRFWNSELFGDFDAVLEAIRLAVESECSSSPSLGAGRPSPERGERGLRESDRRRTQALR